jgi:3-methyladenine DNA glycosylase Mpg
MLAAERAQTTQIGLRQSGSVAQQQRFGRTGDDLPSDAEIETAARAVVAKGLSVRATEALVKKAQKGPSPEPAGPPAKTPAVRDLEERLTKALGVHRKEFNGRPANEPTGLWMEPGVVAPESEVLRTPRIGVDYAGPEWASMPWRFVWKP